MKKPSIDEYKEIGTEFEVLHDRLVKLAVRVGNALPKERSRLISNACDLLDESRSDIEDDMFRHYPNEATTHIFYGGRCMGEKVCKN